MQPDCTILLHAKSPVIFWIVLYLVRRQLKDLFIIGFDFDQDGMQYNFLNKDRVSSVPECRNSYNYIQSIVQWELRVLCVSQIRIH